MAAHATRPQRLAFWTAITSTKALPTANKTINAYSRAFCCQKTSGVLTANSQAANTPATRSLASRHVSRKTSGTDAAPAMTETYVRRLFDQYAQRFDTALTEHLAYRGPHVLREAVERVTKAAGRPFQFRAMLDLGCGTGLGGAPFRPDVDRLVGVDLSPAMIARAEAKDLYDRLATADLTTFLADEAADMVKYDLVLAADVFVYVNNLTPVLAAVARVLAEDGVLAFTVETHAGDGVKLLPTLRYAYGESYLRGLLTDARLEVAHLAAAAVRSEKGIPVDSLVVVAQKREQ